MLQAEMATGIKPVSAAVTSLEIRNGVLHANGRVTMPPNLEFVTVTFNIVDKDE